MAHRIVRTGAEFMNAFENAPPWSPNNPHAGRYVDQHGNRLLPASEAAKLRHPMANEDHTLWEYYRITDPRGKTVTPMPRTRLYLEDPEEPNVVWDDAYVIQVHELRKGRKPRTVVLVTLSFT